MLYNKNIMNSKERIYHKKEKDINFKPKCLIEHLITSTIKEKRYLVINKYPIPRLITEKYSIPEIKKGGTFIIEKPKRIRFDIETLNEKEATKMLLKLFLFFIKKNKNISQEISKDNIFYKFHQTNIESTKNEKYLIKNKPEYSYKYAFDNDGHPNFKTDPNSQRPHINYAIKENNLNFFNKPIINGHIFWIILFELTINQLIK